MMRGMYAAISGLGVHQTMLDVTANNLANVDTVGYKAQRTTFVDQLSQTLRGASGASNIYGGSSAVQVGLGVGLGSIDNLMGQGAMQSTGNALDVAIQGDGFLRLGGGTPPTTAPYTATFNTITYTRAGNLTLNPQGFLMTPDGQYVIGRNVATGGGAGTSDSYINVPPSSSTVTVGQDGSVNYIDSSGNRQIAGYISLAKFPDQAGLARAGGTQWTPTANSGTEQVGTPNGAGYGQTIAGVLESSNVDLATEFTNMITAERGFQANSRVITTADEMLQTVVQMKQ